LSAGLLAPATLSATPGGAVDPSVASDSQASLSGQATPSPTPVIIFVPAANADFISATVQALGAPLADIQAKSGKSSLSVAAGGFRELVTGERSPLCEHLDSELNNRLRIDTPYGVPSNAEIQDAWASVGGNAADMNNQPGLVRKYGRLLSVDVVLTGYYQVGPDSVSITVRLLKAADGVELWSGLRALPLGQLARGDLNLYSDSAPPNYGVDQGYPEVQAPAGVAGAPLSPSASASAPSGLTGSASGLSATAAAQAPPFSPRAVPSAVRLDPNIHETEFSLYRINLGVGYKFFDPLNATFKALSKDMNGAYLNLNWADILHFEFDYWYLNSLPYFSYPDYPVSNLFAYSVSLALTAPARLGHHWVVYGGLGGRFETINVSSPVIPSEDAVSFGNNSLFVTGGVKAHRGNVGLDANVAYDLLATYTPYFTAKLGMYYEYSFE
jgi:hypothetical protein